MTHAPDPDQMLEQAKRAFALDAEGHARLEAEFVRRLDALGTLGASPAAGGSSALALGKAALVVAAALTAAGIFYARRAPVREPMTAPPAAALALPPTPASAASEDRDAAPLKAGEVVMEARAQPAPAQAPQRTTTQGRDQARDSAATVASAPAPASASEWSDPATEAAGATRSRERAARRDHVRVRSDVGAPGGATPHTEVERSAIEDDLLGQPETPSEASPRAAPASPDLLAAELSLIRSASRALSARRPAQALQALERHEELYGRGRLAEERDGLTAVALCAAGQVAAARASAARFLARYPSSALATRVRAASQCAPAR